MQIDFHHTVTYVAARLAGFNQDDAGTIAYAAQYADDCKSSGTVQFNNGAIFDRISSAHKMIDTRNGKEVANHRVWVPFHFLPGNGGQKAGQNPGGGFINKLICRPDSPVAHDMIDACIAQKDQPYGLHLLGITMHVYADTWAHQGFAGVKHDINEVEDAIEISKSGVFDGLLGRWLRDLLDDTIPSLGHGRANILPDMPFIEWRYENHQGETITRNNTETFREAANHLCKAMQRYRNATEDGIDSDNMDTMTDLFAGTKEKKGKDRHEVWLKAIKKGQFSFGKEELSYEPRGDGSWKAQALGTSDDLKVHTYRDSFLNSNWRYFHTAVKAHRFNMVHDILPRYGICTA